MTTRICKEAAGSWGKINLPDFDGLCGQSSREYRLHRNRLQSRDLSELPPTLHRARVLILSPEIDTP